MDLRKLEALRDSLLDHLLVKAGVGEVFAIKQELDIILSSHAPTPEGLRNAVQSEIDDLMDNAQYDCVTNRAVARDRILALCNDSGLRAWAMQAFSFIRSWRHSPKFEMPEDVNDFGQQLQEEADDLIGSYTAALQSPPAPESSEVAAFENRLVNTMRFAALVKDMRMLAIRVLGMGDRQPGYEAWQDAVRKEVQGFAQEMLERLDAIIAADGHIPPAPAQESELCDRCKKNSATDPHPCPYRQEIDDDNESLCTCCSECQQECSDNI